MRERREEDKSGWKLITTSPHVDRVDWAPLPDWCHSDEASTEDNDNKLMVKVYATSLKDDAKVNARFSPLLNSTPTLRSSTPYKKTPPTSAPPFKSPLKGGENTPESPLYCGTVVHEVARW